ncbi:MmcQ/YjbR family DNA-binding protein [Marinilabilia salmonicolor]|jgi:predicted DNA-binding protein (MmcQ/YjbR family)|uniref:Putative DNA-binding protein (MmcQ/YjbR family) n=1 Tax=Marinilabilia salmonicolor TaxID=989 RepID=A0A2T0WXG6_9BACT|nr:MmcQ/YjbR family DNA-binding protein [Marinilabilia salmonicolor]PRY91388.1 putative DNA-binding protein (MmcQ/YjbR family) [Marinilabilia salmonicolor]RCW37522.1 putative DNA-binding protein (MmcQ/YjbR family) [Marinilabilia salmonicolor]
MNIEEFREYCLSLPATSEDLPFDETSLVFKVGKKMFALTDLEGPFWINLKCDPAKAIELREQHPAVRPGYHMSKKHWNTIEVDGSVSDDLIRQWTKDSYDLVVKGMTRKERESIDR